MKLKVATRGSKLALKQTELACDYLKNILEDVEFEMVIIKTHGDRDQNRALYQMTTNGIFVKDIEEALLQHQADIAIHSLKDVGSNLDDSLMLLPYVLFEDKRDCLLSKEHKTLMELKEHAVIATSSVRRMACIRKVRPDIQFVNIRGNIDTRIKRFEEEGYDGLVLASAGLQRLGLTDRIDEYLDPTIIIPACGQGTIAMEIRKEEKDLYQKLFRTQDVRQKEVEIERAFLKDSHVGCHFPVGCYCKIQQGIADVYAMVGNTIEDCRFVHLTSDDMDHIAKQALKMVNV